MKNEFDWADRAAVMAAAGQRVEADDRADYLWFLEHGFRWPQTREERNEIHPACEYDVQQRGEELSEENRATARYAPERAHARDEMAAAEMVRMFGAHGSWLPDLDGGDEDHEEASNG